MNNVEPFVTREVTDQGDLLITKSEIFTDYSRYPVTNKIPLQKPEYQRFTQLEIHFT